VKRQRRGGVWAAAVRAEMPDALIFLDPNTVRPALPLIITPRAAW